jgi:aspartate dehydrogenase
MSRDKKVLRLGIAGLGAIGLAVAKRVDRGELPGVKLVAVAEHDEEKVNAVRMGFRDVPAFTSLTSLSEGVDVVLEGLPPRHFAEVAEPTLARGRILIPLSVGAFLNHMNLIGLAQETCAKIYVPTGALLGLDAVRAAAEGRIESITMTTRKPPAGLEGAPLLVERGITLSGIAEPVRVFSGTAREAIAGFPANVNVAVALSLAAGIGPDALRLEIWADPGVTRNTHTIAVKSDAAHFTMTIENIPSENPRTGRIAAQSAMALLRRLSGPMIVGS